MLVKSLIQCEISILLLLWKNSYCPQNSLHISQEMFKTMYNVCLFQIASHVKYLKYKSSPQMFSAGCY